MLRAHLRQGPFNNTFIFDKNVSYMYISKSLPEYIYWALFMGIYKRMGMGMAGLWPYLLSTVLFLCLFAELGIKEKNIG